MKTEVPFGESVLSQIRGAQRKPLSAFADFQCLQLKIRNQYTKVAYFRVVCYVTLQ